MEEQVNHFEFINSLTGNAICYLSVPADVPKHELHKRLEKRRTELATTNGLYVGLIYWQLEGHVIR